MLVLAMQLSEATPSSIQSSRLRYLMHKREQKLYRSCTGPFCRELQRKAGTAFLKTEQ
jgi:hypothetical protein